MQQLSPVNVHAPLENVTTFSRDLSFINMSIAQFGTLCKTSELYQIDSRFPFLTQLIELYGSKRDVMAEEVWFDVDVNDDCMNSKNSHRKDVKFHILMEKVDGISLAASSEIHH